MDSGVEGVMDDLALEVADLAPSTALEVVDAIPLQEIESQLEALRSALRRYLASVVTCYTYSLY